MCRAFESSLEPSLKGVTEPHANSRVPARGYDVEYGAIFAEHICLFHSDGFAWIPRGSRVPVYGSWSHLISVWLEVAIYGLFMIWLDLKSFERHNVLVCFHIYSPLMIYKLKDWKKIHGAPQSKHDKIAK